MTVEDVMPVDTLVRRSKTCTVRVMHLDETVHNFNLSHNASGAELYVYVIRKFNIIESDYFDLEFINEDGVRCWMDHTRPLIRQIANGKDLVFRFCVKFYTPHPNLLEEEYTRYLFALQIKRDLTTGVLICSENTAALLGSYIVQAEIGDFIKEEYRDISYLRNLKIIHEPSDDRLKRVMDFHKNHIGMSPTDADFALLDTARKVEFYGIRLHPTRNVEGLPMSLAVTHHSLSVFQNLTKISTFSWAKIRKLSFRRKRFLIKLHSVDYDVIEFLFDTRNDCKRFWKKCIEQHAFFRCPLQERSWQRRPRVVTKGSSFRYIGRTQKELIRFMRENNLRRPPFERPSVARRAHPTMLTGPNYAHARMGTMSMTLRSKSADHRRHQILDSSQLQLHRGIISSSRHFLSQVDADTNSVSQLKRAHSSFVSNAANIGLSTAAVVTSGYSTMGGSSSGGHLAGEDLNVDVEPLKDGGSDGAGDRVADQELSNTMASHTGIEQNECCRQPSPVVTVPPDVSASRTSTMDSTEAYEATTSESPPSKPTRVIHTTETRRRNSEFNCGSYSGTLKRQVSSANRQTEDSPEQNIFEEESLLHSGRISTSAIHNFGHRPQTSARTLTRPTSGLLPSLSNTTTMTTDTIVTTAQVRTPFVHTPKGSEAKLTIGSEKNLHSYSLYLDKEEMLQAEEKIEETPLPPSMKLLGTACQCKTSSTQTVPTSDSEGDGGDCKTVDLDSMREPTVKPFSSNPGRSNHGKMHQPSKLSSSGRFDSLFDGGTESSAVAAQIIGIDQWSSSGTESTTGVIIRSGLTAEWTSGQTMKSDLETSNVQHISNCPMQKEKITHTVQTDSPSAGTSQPRVGGQPWGFSYGFSRSIPAGVHLAGLPNLSDESPLSKTSEACFLSNRVETGEDLLTPGEQLKCSKPPSFEFISRHSVRPSHILPSHTCNAQGRFNSEGVAPCLYMHALRLQDVKMGQRQHRARATVSHLHHHHHHDHSRVHHREEERRRLVEASPHSLSYADMCWHGQLQCPYDACEKRCPAHKGAHRNRELASARAACEAQPYRPSKRNKQQCKYTAQIRQPRPESASMTLKGDVEGDNKSLSVLPVRAHCSHRNSSSSSTLQPSSLVPKPIEAMEGTYACKLHSQTVNTPNAFAIQKRQDDGKALITEARKHHRHLHCHLRGQEEQLEAPHRLKHRPVQSPALVNEEPHSLGISSPIVGDDKSRAKAVQAPLVPTAVASVAKKRLSTSREYTEKIMSHKASIEALKKELRSVETASSPVTTPDNSIIKSNAALSHLGPDDSNSFSRGLIIDRPVHHPSSSISPSDEAAARLADALGSASFRDIKSAILASGKGSGQSLVQRTILPVPEKDNRLPVSLRGAAYLESDSDSSPEQVGINTVRSSLHESASKNSSVPPPGMLSPGDAPKPPFLPRSSSFTSTNSSDSSVVSYSRSQSLFSHGTAFSNESSVSQQSSSSDLFSNEERSFSTMSPSVDCYSRPQHPHRTCRGCIFRSQGHLQSYTDNSHDNFIPHSHQQQSDCCDQKSSERRSKSHNSSCDTRLESVLLKTLLSDELALETITRQKNLLKRELTKQKQLVEELEETKRRTQRLIEEKTKLKQKAKEIDKKIKPPQKIEKKKARKHNRSSSFSKKHPHHRKSHRRFRGQFSESEKERHSEEGSKKVSSIIHDEKQLNYVSHQKRSHSKSRHHHHHKTIECENNKLQAKSSKEQVSQTIFGAAKENEKPLNVQKHAENQAVKEINLDSTQSEVNEKTETVDLLIGKASPLPPPPQTLPLPQPGVISTNKTSFQGSSIPKTKSPDGSFISPSHHHELTSICLESVPEGRVAETYSASRPYCSDFTTFLNTTSTSKVRVPESADLDVEDLDSDSTSSSEGSEDIEPFSLPPAPLHEINIIPKAHKLPSSSGLKRGKEQYQAFVEIKGGSVPETSLLEHSALITPITPVRLSRALVVEQPESIKHGSSSSRIEMQSSGGEEAEKDDLVTSVHHSAVTPSRKPRCRRKAAKQRPKSVSEKKSASDAIMET